VFLAALLRGEAPLQAARDANAVAAGWVAAGSYGG
jgi:sugar/nucleoside kinase (ribokinase family)